MTAQNSSLLDGFVGVAVGSLGLFCLVGGLLLLPESGLGGLWIAAIGANFLAAALVGSTWGRQRLGLAPSGGTSAAVGFVAVAVVLAVGFVAVNFSSFSSGGSAVGT